MAKRSSREFTTTLEQQLKQFKPVRGAPVLRQCNNILQQPTTTAALQVAAGYMMFPSILHAFSVLLEPCGGLQPQFWAQLLFERCSSRFQPNYCKLLHCSATWPTVNPFPLMMDAARQNQTARQSNSLPAAQPTSAAQHAETACTICSHCG